MNIKQLRARLVEVAAQLPNIRHPVVYVEVNGEAYEVATVEAEPDNDIVVIHINPKATDL